MFRSTTAPIHSVAWGCLVAGTWETGVRKPRPYGMRLDFNTDHSQVNLNTVAKYVNLLF